MKMKAELKLKNLVPAILLPLAVGAAASFLTKDGMAMFPILSKPPLSPPGWLFPAVWTALYILMGLASAIVYASPASLPRRERALTVYAMSLVANFVWPLLFFGLEMYAIAFFWLLLLMLLAAAAALLFRYIDETAGLLMLPYLIWLCFAAYLNLGIWILNR